MKKISLNSLDQIKNENELEENMTALTLKLKAKSMALYCWNPLKLLGKSGIVPESGEQAGTDHRLELALTDEIGAVGCLEIIASESAVSKYAKSHFISLEAYAQKQNRIKREIEQRTFINGMLHDLRGPWRRMISISSLNEDPSVDREFLRQAQQSEVKGMESLMKMAQACCDAMRPRQQAITDVKAAVDRAIYEHFVKNRAERKNVTVEANFASGSTAAIAEQELSKVFSQLLDNTQKFSSPGMSVEIQQTITRNGWAEISYTDHGAEIDPTYLDRFFTPFFRAHGAPYEGHGLGLYLCRQIIMRNFGRIDVEIDQHTGRGLKYSILLPLAC